MNYFLYYSQQRSYLLICNLTFVIYLYFHQDFNFYIISLFPKFAKLINSNCEQAERLWYRSKMIALKWDHQCYIMACVIKIVTSTLYLSHLCLYVPQHVSGQTPGKCTSLLNLSLPSRNSRDVSVATTKLSDTIVCTKTIFDLYQLIKEMFVMG